MSKRRAIGKRIFTYDEAISTFHVVRDLTSAAVRQEELEEARERIVTAWAQRISSLGCEVKGVWLVDWDSGDGYYCWRFPEQALSYFHTYDEGFEGRIPIN